MSTAQIARKKYDIISWITGLEDKKLIRRLHQLAMNQTEENIVHLSPEQTELLKMSDDDIKNGRLVSEEKLNKLDEQCFV
ncbi:hypothetical protein [Viscerimonas tarda]